MSGVPGTLDPQVLSAIADLELVARVTVDGTIAGLHRSPFHGYSAEFSQYRPYRPGDDLKYVDWKLFARTDRFYTKQFRETTNLVAHLALDASGSMGYRRSQRRLEARVRAAAGRSRCASAARTGRRRRARRLRPGGPAIHRRTQRPISPAQRARRALEAAGLRPDGRGGAVEARGRDAEAARADLRVLGSVRRRRRAGRRSCAAHWGWATSWRCSTS